MKSDSEVKYLLYLYQYNHLKTEEIRKFLLKFQLAKANIGFFKMYYYTTTSVHLLTMPYVTLLLPLPPSGSAPIDSVTPGDGN
jgi:hypothetical protein